MATRTRCVRVSGQRRAYFRARKPPYECPRSAKRAKPRWLAHRGRSRREANKQRISCYAPRMQCPFCQASEDLTEWDTVLRLWVCAVCTRRWRIVRVSFVE